MTFAIVGLVAGVCLAIAVMLPSLIRGWPLSTPLVVLTLGALVGLLPWPEGTDLSPITHQKLVEYFTTAVVLVALTGVGLALDRPLSRTRSAWRAWSTTWRLLAIGMPLAIAAAYALGVGILGLAPAAALLLAASLAPTDPVLAADVQVEGPTTGTQAELEEQHGIEHADEIDESDEVRFALTSEAGLNDAAAFPFVYAAILLATEGAVDHWGWRWLGWDLIGRTVIAIVVGLLVGWLFTKIAFHAPKTVRTAELGEPLLVVALPFTAYGVAEVAHGWGFLAVFVAAMTLRSGERGHSYHADMHELIERLERLLTLVVLLALGAALTNGLLADMSWHVIAFAAGMVLVVRPLTAWVALRLGRANHPAVGVLGPRERIVTAFFGVRGVGSIFYLAYAEAHAPFESLPLLWSTLAATVVLSVLLHGVLATPAMRWLDRAREHRGPDAETGEPQPV